MSAAFFTPNWPLPNNIGAAITTRQGGHSLAPYASNNLGMHVGDAFEAVIKNRQQLQSQLHLAAIQWLDQVHGCEVFLAQSTGEVATADASMTRQPNLGCAVLTADCLPVLFCTLDGSQVAAAHAGWRGLAGGVLLNTLATFPDARLVSVYLGPAIGPSAFEVGPDVRDAFPWASAKCFTASHGDRLQANLYQLAREQLQNAGVHAIYSDHDCTVHDPERFYSYRREGITGRMASLIWIKS